MLSQPICRILGFFPIWVSLLTGCAADGPEPPRPINLYIEAAPTTNNARMVYMVIRNVNQKQFIDEGYNLVAEKAFPTADDPTLLGAHPIFPGEKREINFMMPSKGSAAIYFLFTDPGPYWRNFLEPPVQESYGISLSDGNKVVIGERPGVFDRLFHY